MAERARGWRGFVEAIERRGAGPWTPLATALFIAGLRNAEEHLAIYVPRGLRRDPVAWFGHTVLFYLALILAITALLKLTTGRSPERVLPAVCAGLTLGVLPPLIDVLVYGAGGFTYGYRSTFLTAFPPLLYDPPSVTPLGECVTLWASMLLMAAYARATGSSWARVALTVLGHYALVVLFLAIVPSCAMLVRDAYRVVSLDEATSGLLLAVVFAAFFVLRPPLAPRALRRLPHTLIAPSLVLLGSAIAGRLDANTALAAAAVFVTALVFTLHNDYYDHREDSAMGRVTLVEAPDVPLLTSFLVPAWLVLLIAHFWVGLAAVLFHLIGAAYHGDPHRLKCVFPLSYKTEGLLALVCLGAGVLTHPRLELGSWQVIALLLTAGGATVCATLKDYKDVAGDRAAGVRTLFVVLSARRVPERRILFYVLAATGACLLVPVAWLASHQAPGAAGLLALIGAVLVALPIVVRQKVQAVALALLALNAYLVCLAVLLPPPT